MRLRQCGNRLHDKKVYPRIHQCIGLRGIGVQHLRGVALVRRQPQRAHRTCHKRMMSMLFPHAFHRLPRQPDTSHIDLRHLALKAKAAKSDRVRPKGVRLNQLGARHQVLLVEFPHQRRLREVQLVEAAVCKDAAGVEHRSHRTVRKHGCAAKDALKDVFCRCGRALGHGLVYVTRSWAPPVASADDSKAQRRTPPHAAAGSFRGKHRGLRRVTLWYTSAGRGQGALPQHR